LRNSEGLLKEIKRTTAGQAKMTPENLEAVKATMRGLGEYADITDPGELITAFGKGRAGYEELAARLVRAKGDSIDPATLVPRIKQVAEQVSKDTGSTSDWMPTVSPTGSM
jgi:hypothetical protein